MSRLYEALRKVEEQGKVAPHEPLRPAPLTPPASTDSLLSVPTLQARISPESRIALFSDRRGAASERFRLIRMALRNLNGSKMSKVLLVTSPQPKDGKSTMALNLAISLSEEGKSKVLLVEADVRRPSYANHLGLSPERGLTELLAGGLSPEEVVRRIEPLQIYLLPAGRTAENPEELLQSERFSALLSACKESFEWIILDCPPAIPLVDVMILRVHADGVLLVARAGVTPRESLQEVVQLFKPGQILGLILNGAEDVKQVYRKYYS